MSSTLSHLSVRCLPTYVCAGNTLSASTHTYVDYLPYRWRKLLLDACRIQRRIRKNRHLASTFQELRDENRFTLIVPQRAKHRIPFYVSLDKVCDYFDNIHDNPILCSCLAYFVKAEQSYYLDEFLTIGQENIYKEIRASQLPNLQQALSYECLFTTDESLIHQEIDQYPRNLVRVFKRNLGNLINSWTFNDHMLYIPFYNKRKTVSYPTQTLLDWEITGESTFDQPTHYTTFSLLEHYARTGVQVGGPLELRQSWKFNDLKPRTYYCLGGDAYWRSLYINPITKALLSLLPSTHPFSRYEVKRIPEIEHDQFLITYDYTSFTTSLAELKYFLWHLSIALTSVEVAVLDVRDGLKYIDIGLYLRDYNESINQNQEFSVDRLSKRFRSDGGYIFQNRSGSLGVPGNIGLSTLVHGVSLGGMTDTPEQDSCVGDDALYRQHVDLLVVAGIIINKLGEVNVDKIARIPRPHIDDFGAQERDSFKYLKRPITVDAQGSISQGFLDFFPNISLVLFPEGDGIHTQIPEDFDSSISTVAMQWGKFLNTYALTSYSCDLALDEELDLILSAIQSCYQAVGLPLEGTPPSDSVFIQPMTSQGYQKRPVSFWAPPCDDLEVFKTHWLDLLRSRYTGVYVKVPVWCQASLPIPPGVYPGADFVCTADEPLVVLLADLGYLEVEKMFVERVFDEILVEELKQQFSSGVSHVQASVHVVDLPHYFSDVYNHMYRDEMISGQEDGLSTIHTVFGTSYFESE